MNCFAFYVSLALLVISPIVAADNSSEPPIALHNQLHGTWNGNGPCDGSLLIAADGTYSRRHFSPGNNALTGTWAVRWDELPPTLLLTCKSSDDPDRVGKTEEVKLIQLNDKALAYQYAKESRTRYNKVTK